MRAVTASGSGGPDVLAVSEVADPTPGPGEVLIKVVAAGVNRADVWQREGRYPPPPGASSVLGLECSGTVAEVGEGVTDWHVGDDVCALLSGGGYAELVVAPATSIFRIPRGVELATAAALPEVACTVWSNVVLDASLASGQLILIHGGGGGIGTHAVQVCKAIGLEVAVTAGSRFKLDRCADLGADILINYRDQNFAEVLPRPANIILDHIGAKYLAQNIDALAVEGRLMLIGLMGGSSAEINLARLLRKRASVRATTLRGRPDTGRGSKAEIVASVSAHLWPMIESGTVAPVVHAELPLAEAGRAHELLDAADTVGKVVLRT